MAADKIYWLLRGALDVTVWGGELVWWPDLPPGSPAVYVANHAGALGPIGVVCSLPVRLRPWIIGDMVDRERAGAYLFKDFVGPAMHLRGNAGSTVAAGLARITVPLLLSIGCVPVWQERELLDTLRLTTNLLARGARLLIFPEDPALPVNERTSMRPFKTGFARLGRLFFEKTGELLSFYPVAVHRRRRTVQVAEPIVCNPHNLDASERRRIAHLLESIIAAMLADRGERFGARVSAPS